jgi:hypothetical protein
VRELKRLLKQVGRTIHKQPNLVRYAMNAFVIGAGTYVTALSDTAMRERGEARRGRRRHGQHGVQGPDWQRPISGR